MVRRIPVLLLLILSAIGAEDLVPFVCPMDPDVQASAPGRCPRCGMKLVPKLAEALEYPVDLTVEPGAFRPGQDVLLTFLPRDPLTGEPVKKFEVVHEKLFHLFIVSQDLQYFAHQHPDYDGTFNFKARLPSPGQYRLLCDFFPALGTPQLVIKTIIAPGEAQSPHLKPDLSPKRSVNTEVSLSTEPATPIAGKKTLLFFTLDPPQDLQPYLGAWGHMLAASQDLIDMIHAHPAFPEPGPVIQFNLIFPRPGVHRLWMQFQRAGKVNTVVFDVPVLGL